MYVSATEEQFELVTIFNKPAIFTSLRIDRRTVPDSMYCYDIRDADDGSIASEVKANVLVNHMGTIITKEPIISHPNGKYDYNVEQGIPLDDEDFNFLMSSDMTLDEFMETPDAQLLELDDQPNNSPELNM